MNQFKMKFQHSLHRRDLNSGFVRLKASIYHCSSVPQNKSYCSCRAQHPDVLPLHKVMKYLPVWPSVCMSACSLCVLVCQCQHCCSEQKPCQKVKEVRSGSNLCPAKTDKPQQQSCQDASFGTAVSQHTSQEPDMGCSYRSAWACKSDTSMTWTAAVWQGSTSLSM